jgi:hypothetical protein
MTRRFLFLAALASASALADQWQLTAVSPFTDCNPVCKPSFDMGQAQAGGTVTLPLRLANVAAVSETLYLLEIQGPAGFSINAQTALPITIPPRDTYPTGLFLDLSIVFRPSCATPLGGASARLNINTTTYLVTATVTQAVQACALAPLTLEPASVNFGKAFRGTSVAPRTVVISNPNDQQVVVDTLAVTGQAFDCPACAPTTLAANGSVSLTIGWQPTGTDTGTLTVNQQTVSLTGTAIEPPAIVDITADRVLANRQEARISVKFASPAQASGSGLLKLDFIGKDDTARGFLPTGTKTLASSVPFTIAEGQDTAPAIPFETGTTTGTLLFTATLGDETKQVTFQIGPAAVGIDSVRASRGATGVLVTVTGFDNTRSVSQASFTFYDTSARTIGSGAIAVDVTAAFQSYFQHSGTGSFVLRAAFPVTGNITQIGSVAVRLTNSAGTSSQEPTMLE